MGSDAGDAGAGDWEGAEGEGGALGGEEWAEADDWVSVSHEIPYHEDAPGKCSNVTRASDRDGPASKVPQSLVDDLAQS